MTKNNQNNVDLWVIKTNLNSTHDSLQPSHTTATDDKNKIYRKILANYVGDKKLQIVYDHHGKPQVKDSNIKFNVSHTKNIMVMAVTQGIDIGIDIELKDRKINNPLALAKRFFHPQEYTYLKNNPDEFVKFWSIKEAYVKMKGIGIKYGLHNFYIQDDETIVDELENKTYKYQTINIGSSYICSILPAITNISIKYLD